MPNDFKKDESVPLAERELLLRSGRGDAEAFRLIVLKHQAFAYAIAMRFLGNAADAEDAVQEAFIRVWKHIRTFNADRSFTTWLYRIVANLCLDHIRSAKHRRTPVSMHAAGPHSRTDNPSSHPFDGETEKKLEERETVRMILQWTGHLPAKQRMVFVLRDLQDLSVEEVSGILKMGRASVKSNLFHARKFIREKITALEKEGG